MKKRFSLMLGLCWASVILSSGMPLWAQLPGPEYVLSIDAPSTVDSATVFNATVLLDSSQGQALDGWQFGVCHEPTLNLVSITTGNASETANGGAPVGFHGAQEHATGFTVGVLVDLFTINTLPPGSGYELDVATYEASLDGDTELEFCSNLGNPPVVVAVVISPDYFIPTQVGASIAVGAAPELFIRGDCNGDGTRNIADAIAGLEGLFGMGVVLCTDANDVNDDGAYNIADMIFLLGGLFGPGPLPPAPMLACGADPTADTLMCAVSPSCP